jgi:hypothetical protein
VSLPASFHPALSLCLSRGMQRLLLTTAEIVTLIIILTRALQYAETGTSISEQLNDREHSGEDESSWSVYILVSAEVVAKRLKF